MNKILFSFSLILVLFACNNSNGINEKKNAIKVIQAYETPYKWGKEVFTINSNDKINIIGQTLVEDILNSSKPKEKAYWYLIQKEDKYGWVFGSLLNNLEKADNLMLCKSFAGLKCTISPNWIDFKEGIIESDETLSFLNDSLCFWHNTKSYYGGNNFKETLQIGKYKIENNKLYLDFLSDYFVRDKVFKVKKGEIPIYIEFDIVSYKNSYFLTHNGEKRIYYGSTLEKINEQEISTLKEYYKTLRK